MCGIAGAAFFDEAAMQPAAVAARRMLDALAHRGPDGSGVWTTRGAGVALAMAHARLAIIDLSDAGRQPMRRGHLTVSFNGEIYNYRTLREELARHGAVFETRSDTEVLLAAFEAWGEGALDRLEGMFALALWNDRDHSLLMARDRLGIKPLYYSTTPRRFLFASEVRALLASGDVEARLDLDSFWHYLGYQTAPTPATLLEGVRMLEPGSVLTVAHTGAIRVRRYWDLIDAAGRQITDDTPARVRAQVQERLLDAVQSHLIADVPVGVFLSGGIDSGALVSLVRSAGATPHTFTVSLEEEAFDESTQAELVARHFGAEHVEVRLEASTLLEMMPEVLHAVDHPSGDGVNTFVIARAVRDRGLKVALSGLGGDEMFGGYPSFHRLPKVMPSARQWGKSPAGMKRAAAHLVRAVGRGTVSATKAASVLEGPGTLAGLWPVTRQMFSEHDRRRLVEAAWFPDRTPPDAYQPILDEAYARIGGLDASAQISFAESRAYMHDVLLRDADQMSMAHALEVRVPLLDHRLAEYIVAQPASLKLRAGHPKALLADSLPEPLPASIGTAPKRGFTLPFDVWMRGGLRAFCEAQLGANGLDGRGLFRPGQLFGLWRGFLDRTPGVTWSRIWSLVALNAWLDRHHVDIRR